MGFYDVDPPEYPDPDDYYIEEATVKWYEMQMDENEKCMTPPKEYINNTKMMHYIIKDLMKVLDYGENFYCEAENNLNPENKLKAINIKTRLNLLDKISMRMRENVNDDLELSCLTEDDEDVDWIWDLACELDREASEPDPDAAYEAWRDQFSEYY